jgi:hypothetical protein
MAPVWSPLPILPVLQTSDAQPGIGLKISAKPVLKTGFSTQIMFVLQLTLSARPPTKMELAPHASKAMT